MEITKCKCGKKIFFAKDEEGKTHVLDASAPVYKIEEAFMEAGTVVKRIHSGYVSHFATCKNANDFSGRGRKP